eukprot:531590_1
MSQKQNTITNIMIIYLTIFNFTPLQSETIYSNSFRCDGGEHKKCQSDTLQCDSGRACTVQCDVVEDDRRRLLQAETSSSRNLLWSCSSSWGGCCGATINCPSGYSCDIDCNYKCHGLTVNAQSASTVSITNCDNCDEMTINCPTNGRGPTDGRCTLEIEDNISQLTVNAEESFYDFTLTRSTSHCWNGGCDVTSSTLQCGVNGQHSCGLTTDASTCTNTNNICIDYRIPTTSPTNDPTISPSNNPTISPTNNPTNYPTNIPSVPPSKTPTINSNYPTKFPTVSPTLPTNKPTVSPTENTKAPTNDPTSDPTHDPTRDPTTGPTVDPTTDPTIYPTAAPSDLPTAAPSNAPSIPPTKAPTLPEGHVGVGNTDSGGNENEQDLEINGNGGAAIGNWIYIVIGAGLCLCCLLILVIIGKKRRDNNVANAKSLNYFGTHPMQNDGLHNTTYPMKKVQSVSIVSSDNNTNPTNSPYEGGGINTEQMDVFDNDNDSQIMKNMMTPGGDDIDHMEAVILNGVNKNSLAEGNNNPLIQMSEIQEGTYNRNNILTAGSPSDFNDHDEVDDIGNYNDDDDNMVITAGGPVENDMDDDIDGIDNNIGNDDDMDIMNVNNITVGGGMGYDDGIDNIDNQMGAVENDMEIIGDDMVETLHGGNDDDDDDIEIMNEVNTAMGGLDDLDGYDDDDEDVLPKEN